ncbi:MAG: DUF5752 family protein [Candidatus Kariarchaeaceae archaeon]|jgi:CheY-like chemotaxis protein
MAEETHAFPENYRNKFDLFYDLQLFTVKEVLLVSSLYDDFILEEDGRLSEELTEEFSELDLSSPPPRIIRVSTGQQALEAIQAHEFDMVITMLRLSDMDPFTFGQQVKELNPDLPTVLLLTNHSDTLALPDIDLQEGIDWIFTWQGDSDLFLAIFKIVEDYKNAPQDTSVGKVRVIIVIEDTITYYSIFLPMIYKEILKQTKEIIEEGLNASHKMLRRRGRPKLLLAKTYEEATTLYDTYKDHLLGIITDVAFPLQGVKDYSAGVKLIRFVRTEKKYLPVLIQSSDPKNDQLADSLNSWFVHKNSQTYLRDFRTFLRSGMLFGDFVFRTKEMTEVARAENLINFERVLQEVPSESILYHARQNHFSNWLYSRGEHQLANELAPYVVDQFESIEDIRTFLLNAFEEQRREQQRGIIAGFSRDTFDFTTPFSRIGNGSLGGKGRGIAFISTILHRGRSQMHGIPVTIPETVALTTEIYDIFIEQNNLYELLKEGQSDLEVKDRFLKAELPVGVQEDLRLIVESTNSPLAVRSSSLLEDSQFHPLAGVYKTYMLPNDHPEAEFRFVQLQEAVKLVYASAFSPEAKSYITSMGQKVEVEKMAVIIQKVAGKKRNSGYFYPDFSGVSKSINYYPVRGDPEDGVVEVAVGLGEMVVSGGQSLQFSPNFPKILPQASTVEMVLKNSQREFLAIKMDESLPDLREDEFITLDTLPLTVARDDGVLEWLGAVYDHANNRIANTVHRDGALVVTFPYLLQYPKFPLADVINALLELGQETLGYPVEIEFACNIDYESGKHHFYVLQIRPLIIDDFGVTTEEINVDSSEDHILYSPVTLGNGTFRNIADIIFIDPDRFDKTQTMEIKAEISEMNRKLREDGREYLLIGFGRWGTSDRFLGVPVQWQDIDAARIIVEASLPGFQIDPSQGMHFFHNITASKRAYITLSHVDKRANLDWTWLQSRGTAGDFEYIRHVKLERPLSIVINGKTGEGIVREITDEFLEPSEK